jgi:hypothetical protein
MSQFGFNKDGSPKKDGRGKPAGKKDTVTVGREFILELFEHGLKGIVVSRKWVRECEQFYGVKFIEPDAPVTENLTAAKDAVPRERLVVKEEQL